MFVKMLLKKLKRILLITEHTSYGITSSYIYCFLNTINLSIALRYHKNYNSIKFKKEINNQ